MQVCMNANANLNICTYICMYIILPSHPETPSSWTQFSYVSATVSYICLYRPTDSM